MIAALLLSLTLSTAPAPALHLQPPDWAFLQRSIQGAPTSVADVDAFLAQLDAEADITRGPGKPSPFEDDPFDAGEYDPKEDVAEIVLGEFADELAWLVRP